MDDLVKRIVVLQEIHGFADGRAGYEPNSMMHVYKEAWQQGSQSRGQQMDVEIPSEPERRAQFHEGARDATDKRGLQRLDQDYINGFKLAYTHFLTR